MIRSPHENPSDSLRPHSAGRLRRLLRWLAGGLPQLVLLVSVAAASGDPYPRIWNYRSNRSTGGLNPTAAGLYDGATVPLLSGTIQSLGVRDRARWHLNTYTITPWSNPRGASVGQVIDSIRTYRPVGYPHGYIPTANRDMAYSLVGQWFQTIGVAPSANDSTFQADQQRVMNANNNAGWLLASAGVAHDSPCNVNWGNRSFADAMINQFVAAAQMPSPRWDGMFLDVMVPTCGSGYTSPAYDVSDMGYRDVAQMDSAALFNIGRLIDALHAVRPGFLVFANIDRSGNPRSCIDSMLALHPVDGELKEGLTLVGLNGSLTSADSAIAFVQRPTLTYKLLKGEVHTGTSPTTANVLKSERDELAITCMGDGWMWLGQGDSGICQWDQDTRCQWYDEYSVNVATGAADTSGRYIGWLGQPLAAAQLVSTGVWVRYFRHGVVVVNNSGSTVTVPLGANYRAITGVVDATTNNGKVMAAVTVPTGDARFLCPYPSGYSCPWPDVCPIW